MGKGRTSPKALRAMTQRRSAGFNAAFLHMLHGNPKGQDSYIITDDYRAIATWTIPEPVSSRREEVNKTKERLKNEELEKKFYVRVANEHFPKGIKLFFGKDHFFFRQDTDRYSVTSIVYTNRDRALMHFENNSITWIEFEAAPPPVGSG